MKFVVEKNENFINYIFNFISNQIKSNQILNSVYIYSTHLSLLLSYSFVPLIQVVHCNLQYKALQTDKHLLITYFDPIIPSLDHYP